jgi:hypothetical protein
MSEHDEIEINFPMALAGVRPTMPPRQRNASFHAVLLGEETDILERLCNGTPGAMLLAPVLPPKAETTAVVSEPAES